MYLRDTLLCAAEAGLYQVRWTNEILAGAFRNLIKDDHIDKTQADRLHWVTSWLRHPPYGINGLDTPQADEKQT